MQNTKFEEIYHLFLNSIQDYTIRHLFVNNLEVAQDMMQTFLVRSVPKFYNCVKKIKDYSLENNEFNCELDSEEKNILSELMVISWMDWVINDITQMSLNLNDTDFRHFSEESNLKQKSEYTDRLREKANQDIVNYGLYHTPFEQWAVGNYGL